MVVRRIFSLSIALAFAIAGLVSCSRPSSIETFINAADVSEGGTYIFNVDMTDPNLTYDISFYTEIGDRNTLPIGKIPFNVIFSSPSGKRYEETVYMTASNQISANDESKQYKAFYRKAIVPSEYGIWHMSVMVGEENFHINGLRGLGIIVANNKISR
jgi:hypothetical protein